MYENLIFGFEKVFKFKLIALVGLMILLIFATFLLLFNYSIRQLESLLRISAVLGPTHPELQQRSMSRYAYVSAMFNRG